MGKVAKVVASVAGYAASSLLGGGVLGALGGFVVSSAVSRVVGRAQPKKAAAQVFSQEASGRATVIRSSIESHKIVYGTARVSGPLVHAATTDHGQSAATGLKTNKMLHLVVPLAGHEVQAIGTVYFNDQPLTIDAWGFVMNAPYYFNAASYARVTKFTGSPDQVADPFMVSECPGWTYEHRLRGIAYLHIRLEYSGDVYPLGIPNISAVVQGKKVYDPRTGLTQWSDNAALCVRDYLTADYGFGCATDEINDSFFIAAANVCDEDVTLTTGGVQNRYTCNGVLNTASAPLDNLNSLVTSLVGAVTYVQGRFRLHAGAYDAPAGDIDTSMLAGTVKAQLRVPRKELFNAVKGTYVDPNRNWQPTDFPFVTNATYETQDGGERIYKDVELPFTNHPEAAQRIGKLLLEKGRQGIIVEVPLNHSALQYAPMDTVRFTDPQFGWTSKVFRILKVNTSGIGPITLTMQEESSASYDWNSGQASSIDAAPDTNLPDPFSVLPPGTPQVTEVLYATTDGSGVKSKAVVTWVASNDAFTRDYQLEYLAPGASAYTVVGRTFGTTLEAFDLTPGVYTFRVKAANNLGVSSAYASAVASIAGITAPPAAITGFSLNAIHNNAHLSWSQVPDLDVRVGGSIRIRYTTDLNSPNWSGALDIGPALPGVATQAVLPLLNGTYLAKAVDSAGNESTDAASIKSTIADVVKMNQIIDCVQHPTFPGYKTFVEVVDGSLQIEGEGTFDGNSLGLFDDAPGFFDAGAGEGFETGGVYLFDGPFAYRDMGKITTARVTARVTALVYDATMTFDEQVGEFDNHSGSFDGEDISSVSVRLQVSTTEANPATIGADDDAWSEYRDFFVGDYTCRAFRFRLILGLPDSDEENPYNVSVSELSVSIDVPDIVDSGTLTTSASAVTAVSFARTFVVEPDVGITIQDAASGDYEVVQSITKTGFNVGVKTGGSFVARTVSWAASGY